MSTTWINRGHLYAPHVLPVLADCSFKVAPADAGGLGITGLTGQAVANVFMHTSTTPGRGTNGKLNPNPANGVALIQLADNYTRLYSVLPTTLSPLSGSSLVVNATALTLAVAYVITAVGTTTAADWLTLGVPPGVVPAVGVSFIAASTGTGAGSGTVQATVASGIDAVEVIGNPTTTLGPIPVGGSPNVGGLIMIQFLSSTATANTALIAAAPVVGTTVSLLMYLNQSSILIKGA